MEQSLHRKQKKKDKKPLYILLGFVVFFGVFIYFITRPSIQSKAIDQVQVCSTINEVKLIFEQYKFELLENDENGNKIVALEFQDAVRKKLNSFKINDEELKKCLEWLPAAKKSINIIVIPDLSRRIIDTINNPKQIDNDLFVLNTIWHSFVDYSKFKQDTKDRLMVDVTDIDQARGQFGTVANQLQFDLSTHKGKSNRLFFTADKDRQYSAAVTTMYELAKARPLGANYRFYFGRYLKNHIKKSTLFEDYINKVIIITDGYLEYENGIVDTKMTPQLYRSVEIGNTKEVINSLFLNIPTAPIDLSSTDVMVCEINERKIGKTKDFEILKVYWEDWLNRMGAKVSFVQRELANDLTKKNIEEFIKN
jgi:hypothetical protein